MTDTMVAPGATVGAADDTGVTVQPTTPAVSPASSGTGWSSYSNNKKLGIGAAVGVVAGLGVYIWIKHKKQTGTGTTNTSGAGANNNAPVFVLPSSNQDAVQGANDAALDTALGSIGTELNSVGSDVNNLQPTTTINNIGGPGSTLQTTGGGTPAVSAPGQALVGTSFNTVKGAATITQANVDAANAALAAAGNTNPTSAQEQFAAGLEADSNIGVDPFNFSGDTI